MCPLSNKLAVVRAQCNGKLYWFSDAGKITPALAAGQDYIKTHAVMWEGPEKPPEGVRIQANYRGAPPIVTVESKPLTGEGAQKREETAHEAPVKKRRSGIFEFLEG